MTQLVNQGRSPVIRRAKKPSQPKTQASGPESGSESESDVSSDESCDPHKARPLPPTSVAGSSPSRKSSTGSKASSKGGTPKSIRMMCFGAKLQVQSEYQAHHERRLRMIPEDFAVTINDLAERPGVMYDSNAMEQADWAMSLVLVRLLLGSEGYDGEWRHMTPPPGGPRINEHSREPCRRRES